MVLVLLVAAVYLGISWKYADGVTRVTRDPLKKTPAYAFFIECADDHTVALHHGLDLVAASANPNTQLWVVQDCGHVKAFITHPQEWTTRVIAFLDAQLR